MKTYKALLIILVILIVDQATKFWVKTHMMIGEEIRVTDWFIINFVENPGMAFGMVLPGVWGKLFLSAFRLGAVAGGVWFLLRIIKKNEHWGFIASVALILAGAIGNMIDGTFYGILFNDSYGHAAQFLPKGGGYAGWMQGLVVDMVQVKLFNGILPQWVPIWGGTYFEFFPFIFNVADAAITVGVFIILIFQKAFFTEDEPAATAQQPATVADSEIQTD